MDYNVRSYNMLFSRGNLFVRLFKVLFVSEQFREHINGAIISVDILMNLPGYETYFKCLYKYYRFHLIDTCKLQL